MFKKTDQLLKKPRLLTNQSSVVCEMILHKYEELKSFNWQMQN